MVTEEIGLRRGLRNTMLYHFHVKYISCVLMLYCNLHLPFRKAVWMAGAWFISNRNLLSPDLFSGHQVTRMRRHSWFRILLNFLPAGCLSHIRWTTCSLEIIASVELLQYNLFRFAPLLFLQFESVLSFSNSRPAPPNIILLSSIVNKIMQQSWFNYFVMVPMGHHMALQSWYENASLWHSDETRILCQSPPSLCMGMCVRLTTPLVGFGLVTTSIYGACPDSSWDLLEMFVIFN